MDRERRALGLGVGELLFERENAFGVDGDFGMTGLIEIRRHQVWRRWTPPIGLAAWTPARAPQERVCGPGIHLVMRLVPKFGKSWIVERRKEQDQDQYGNEENGGAQFRLMRGYIEHGTPSSRVGSVAARLVQPGPLVCYRKGAAYINPPFVHRLLRPRSSLTGEPWPSVRSKSSP